MALTFTFIPGPSGVSGPNAAGEFAEEHWSVTHDGSDVAETLSAKWLTRIDAVIGGGDSSVVIDNAASPKPTAAFTFAAALTSGFIQYFTLVGRR